MTIPKLDNTRDASAALPSTDASTTAKESETKASATASSSKSGGVLDGLPPLERKSGHARGNAAKYARFKKEVDAALSQPLGLWEQVKATWDPNSFSDARKKQAIDKAEANLRKAVTPEQKSARLYQAHNVIGSTTRPGQRPTVYYRSSSGTFGRITQEHINPANIGRELPRKNAAYSMGNTGSRGQLEERIGQKVIHTSRNPFVPALTDDERQELSSVQEVFPDLKPKHKKPR